MVEQLIWLFSLASGRIPPVDCSWTRDPNFLTSLTFMHC